MSDVLREIRVNLFNSWPFVLKGLRVGTRIFTNGTNDHELLEQRAGLSAMGFGCLADVLRIRENSFNSCPFVLKRIRIGTRIFTNGHEFRTDLRNSWPFVLKGFRVRTRIFTNGTNDHELLEQRAGLSAMGFGCLADLLRRIRENSFNSCPFVLKGFRLGTRICTNGTNDHELLKQRAGLSAMGFGCLADVLRKIRVNLFNSCPFVLKGLRIGTRIFTNGTNGHELLRQRALRV